MKLAIICTEKLPAPSIKGGAIQMMIDGVTPFLSKLYELTIFSVSDPELPNQESANGVTYIRFPREDYRQLVANELFLHQFDVIHICNRPKNVLLYKQSSPDSKIVLSLHNDMFSLKKLSDEEGNEIVDAVDTITTVSNYIKETVVKRFPTAKPKIIIVYSGVDLSSYPLRKSKEWFKIRDRFREMYNLENKKVILFVGRLSKTKGPHLLIQAMQALVKKHDNLVLLIVGGKWFSDDGMNHYVQSLYTMAKHLGDKVIFTKYIPAERISEAFIGGDMFVCSSQWNEPLARVHYEAMAAGIPLITTNRGGNAEVILDNFNGQIIDDYDDPTAFAKTIHYVLKEPEICEWMCHNGRKFIESNFTFKHVANRLITVYENTLQLKEETEIPCDTSESYQLD
ncbi:glycosyltransferase family 4 protein [Sutcliffiella rhizosphaerae]|uniref:Spore coat protein SA n=1 Tax=Sutcliffiella rhizosphaerae TaxID=2880967 RepID=A0ABM8YKL4_9BACI|nr:glycosyltransferase family 4 protein [Sutcliffiella rhizosphaerae]CAG9620282.1 Spore coat protein SA [Sutcliffiella rhizosphaerae]